MTKLLQASVLAALFIFLAACGDESTPAGTPLPAAAPEPTSTALPRDTSTPAPAQPSIPYPAGTPALAPSPSPTLAVDDLKVVINDDTTWRELFDTLTGSERSCMETGLGDDLERLLDSRILGGLATVAELVDSGVFGLFPVSLVCL